jgi:paraquat-inducible protein B
MTAVGAFVIAAIGLAVVAIVLLSSGALFRDTIAVVSLFDGSVQGLQIGAPVSFRGVQIGMVKEIRLALPNDPRFSDPDNVDARIPVVYEIDRTLLAARGGRPEQLSEERVRQLVEQGLRAQLFTESFVTGRLLISLDFRPDVEARLDDWDLGYVEVPTIATPIEEIQQQLAEVDIEALMASADRLMNSFADVAEDTRVEDLTASMEHTLSQLDQTLSSFRDVAQDVSGNIDQVSDRAADRAEQLETVLAEAELTLAALRHTLDPQSPIAVQMAITLREFGDAAHSLRVLTEALEQNPGALLRGRALPEGNR